MSMIHNLCCMTKQRIEETLTNIEPGEREPGQTGVKVFRHTSAWAGSQLALRIPPTTSWNYHANWHEQRNLDESVMGDIPG